MVYIRYFIMLIGAIFIFLLRHFILNLPFLVYWKIRDISVKKEYFPLYGCTFFVGKQGSGKTMSMVHELERVRKKYPKAKIYTNFGYKWENGKLTDIGELLDTSKYDDNGTVFAIDEIQNIWSCSNSKAFPEDILSIITQQRKNRVKIYCTSQVFSRVSKPLREQAFYVCECSTFFGRYTHYRVYDGFDYSETYNLSEDNKQRLRPRKSSVSFVQSDYLRSCYDSYAHISTLIKKPSYDWKI